MYEHTPKNCESITILYSIACAGSPGSWEHPPEDPDIDIKSLEISGVPAPVDLEEILLEQHGDEWTEEIIEVMPDVAAGLEAERAEYLYEQQKDALLEETL